MKNKKFKQQDSDDIDEEDVNVKKANKKKGKKQQQKEPEIPRRPLIERIDEELNQIEFCNFSDASSHTEKLNFDTANRPYFQSYFLDKLMDVRAKKQTVLLLNSLSLTDECLSDLVNLKNLAENDSFKDEYESEESAVEKLEGYFNNIEVLDLSENKLAKIPLRLIRLFKYLKHLKLNDNFINFKNGDLNELMSEDEDAPPCLFKSIELLNMENNKLDSSLTFLSLFKALKYLNLSNNFIKSLNLSQITAQLPKLVDLNVASNRQQIDSDLVAASKRVENAHLRKLNLRNMNLNNLIYNLEGYKNIECLILDENSLEFIPTQLYELEKLKTLSLASNRVLEISEKFCLKSKFRFTLQQLNLSNNSLQTEHFSEKFYLFKSLTKLDLSGNKLKYIPNTLPESLHELRLNNNRLLTLMIRPIRLLTHETAATDDDLYEIEQLRQRVLNSTSSYQPATPTQQLHYSTVFYLRDLDYLDLSSNQIQEIPNDFGLLNVSLKYLNLSCNLLKQLDIKLCCRGLHNLKYLNLSSNFIKYIPEQICEFKQLEYLYLSHNSIQFINYELCNELSSLLELDLSFNQIAELPLFMYTRNTGAGKIQAITLAQALALNQESSDFANLFTFSLKKLKKISLGSNGIQNVFLFHTIFQQCAALEEVDLSCNRIASMKFENEIAVQAAKVVSEGDVAAAATVVKPRKQILLKTLHTINLSNNQINFNISEKEEEKNVNKKLLRFLLRIYKLAPNLRVFLYDQLNGLKINGSSSLSAADETLDDELEVEELIIDYENEYEALKNSLQVINLSNNCLFKIPNSLFKMNNLKEIYLNGNYIQKIPSSILHVTRTISLIDNTKALVPTANITTAAAVASVPVVEQQPAAGKTSSTTASEITKLPALIQNIETLELNDNKLEQVPENLFMHFKNLKNLKLKNNPLKEPPKDAVCANYVADADVVVKSADDAWSTQCSDLVEDEIENQILNDTLNDSLVSSTSENDVRLAPIRSYMIKYKKREEMLLVNMFVTIKDAIDSRETLFKLMRRLKMPMDKVEIVCNEIADNIKENWSKRLDKTQLRIKKKELPQVQREYILRIQTWKLLNIWRQLFGIDAHSDELYRVLNLMNSNEYEEALLNKVKSLKYTSSAIKI